MEGPRPAYRWRSEQIPTMYLPTYEFVPHDIRFCTGTNRNNTDIVQFVHVLKTGPVRPSFRASGRPSDGIPEASVHVLGREPEPVRDSINVNHSHHCKHGWQWHSMNVIVVQWMFLNVNDGQCKPYPALITLCTGFPSARPRTCPRSFPWRPRIGPAQCYQFMGFP